MVISPIMLWGYYLIALTATNAGGTGYFHDIYNSSTGFGPDVPMIKTPLKLLRNMDRKIRWLFVFSLVAFVCFMGILYQQKAVQENARLEIYNTYGALKKIEKINSMVLETESLSRGFVLTRDLRFKESMGRVHQQLMDSIRDFRLVFRTRNAGSADSLETFALKKLHFQDSLISAPHMSEAQLQTFWADNGANEITATIRNILTFMRQSEETQLVKNILVNERAYRTGVILALFGGVFATILILVILLQLNADTIRRRKAEENLILSEAKYRNLIENSGVVMFTADTDGMISFTNSHVLHLTGYTAEELIGKHFSILIDSAWIERVVTFYRNQFQKKIPATTMHFLTRSRTGEEIWVEQFAQLLFDNDRITGFQCMVRDITEKKMIELELSRSELKRKENEFRLSSILENTTALIFIKDLQGRYTMVNKRFKSVFGLTDEMVIGKTDYDFNPKERADHYRELDAQVIATLKPIESEEMIETINGRQNLLLVKFPLLDDKQRPFGISGIATDITERTESRRQLEAALKNAEEAKQLQEQFLANMSHEIRTPMNGIHGMTSLLLDTPLNEEQREFATMIQRSVNNLTAIVNDILDVSNLKTGKLTLQKIIFNLHDPLEALRTQFAHEISARNLSFNTTLDERVPALLIGDPYRLKQVLVSLVGNAIKFTKKGAISIHISLKEQNKDGVVVLFRVADTGIGIPGDKLDTIFENFAQASMDISKRYGGAGLGLSISRGLVQIQGGNIEAQSTVGEGSVFSFYLPYGVPESLEEQHPENDRLIARLRGKRFLVVEDNEVNQKLIGFVLQKAGGITDIAGNGREALDYFEQGRKYDLVIMDLQMPVMDGYQTATYIRQELKLSIPIIALTATALKGDQEKCRQVGMDDFMLKPFEVNDLYRRLLRLLYKDEFGNDGPEAAEERQGGKLYDLSLLEELDDNESLLDVVSLFLENTPAEIKQLHQLAKDKSWDELFRLAHKVKGAVAILQAVPIAKLLGSIEEKAREKKELSEIPEKVDKVVLLFADMEKQLRDVQKKLRTELGITG